MVQINTCRTRISDSSSFMRILSFPLDTSKDGMQDGCKFWLTSDPSSEFIWHCKFGELRSLLSQSSESKLDGDPRDKGT